MKDHFWEEEWFVAGDPFYVKFWVNVHAPAEAKSPILNR